MKVEYLLKILFLNLVVILTFTAQLSAQQVESSKYANQYEIDSLKNVIDSLIIRLEVIENNPIKTQSIDSLLITLNEPSDTSIIPEDQRSRRKQLDALLEYISKKPGQLFFNGQANTILQSNLITNNRFSTANGSVNLFASASFGNNSVLFVDLEAIGGNGPDEFASTFSFLNGDAGSTQSEDGFDRIVVNEAWTEFLFIENIFTVTAGKIDLTNYFDNNAIANDENSQFISSMFINNIAFVVPSNSPGIRIRTSILDRFYIQIGFAKAENTGSKIFSDIYKIAGIGFKLFPFSDYEAELHTYGYSHPFADNRFGFGVSLSQKIAGRFIIFGRFGNNENKLAEWYQIKNSWSVGSQFTENLLGEPSVISIAYGSAKPFNSNLLNEKLTEFYIKQQINNWISISTHYQYVWDSMQEQNEYSLLGLRINFTF